MPKSMPTIQTMLRFVFHIFADLALVLMVISLVLWFKSYRGGRTIGYQSELQWICVGYKCGDFHYNNTTYVGRPFKNQGWSYHPNNPCREVSNHIDRFEFSKGTHQTTRLKALPPQPHEYVSISVPIWFVTSLLAIAPLIRLSTLIRCKVRIRLRTKRGLCLACGYSLKGRESPLCPECGHSS